MGVFFDINAGFQDKLKNVPNHPTIIWDNFESNPVSIGNRYWRSSNIPFRGELASVSALQKHQGLFQVDVYIPANKGLALLMNDLDAIYEAFNTTESIYFGDTRLDILNINIGKSQREDSWYRGFIEIYYMCYSH